VYDEHAALIVRVYLNTQFASSDKNCHLQENKILLTSLAYLLHAALYPKFLLGWHLLFSADKLMKESFWVFYVENYMATVVTSFINSCRWPTWRTLSSIIWLFQSSTCFELLCAHPQEDSCINTTSGILRYTGRPLTQSDYTRSCIDTVVLLRMSTDLLETCTGFK
jgi:hypothetical protein